jgi:acyl-CoA synthetase (AMP-forming)/AMP-acid ligase II
VISAAAPLSAPLAIAFMAVYGDVLFNLYGSTETGFASLAGPEDLRVAPDSVGRAADGVTLRILDAERRPVGSNERGWIFVGSPLLFKGYSGGGNKELADGMMNTGDMGRIDAAGRLYVEGREDDMIVSGGENVFPQEVEDVLARHPEVSDVAVIGVPDAEFGARLRAFVVCRGEQANEEELKAHVRKHVARYKVPREVVFLAELPRNQSGKVLRTKLAALSFPLPSGEG